MTRQLECSLEKLNRNKKKYFHKMRCEYTKDVRNNNAIEHKLCTHVAKYINRKYMIAQAMADIYKISIDLKVPLKVTNAIQRSPDTELDARYVVEHFYKLISDADAVFSEISSICVARRILAKHGNF